MPVSKIDTKEQLDEKSAFDYHDLLREGRARELSPFKLCALLKKMVLKINELVDEDSKKSLTLL